MATITLTANTDVSALTLANDDTIDLAGFALTFDVQPTVTGVQVTSPGTAGTCVFPVACVIPTWDFFAGGTTTQIMIATLPANCEIGKAVGGELGTFCRCIGTNNGVVNISQGSIASGSLGIFQNNGLVRESRGGTGSNAGGIATNGISGIVDLAISGTGGRGVNTNNGLIKLLQSTGSIGLNENNGTVEIAEAIASRAISINNATVGIAKGGTGVQAWGVQRNNGTVGKVIGGSGTVAFGIEANNGICLRAEDGIRLAIANNRGDFKLVIGPEFQTEFINLGGDITTIYSIGPLSELATIPPEIEVVELSEGAAFSGIGRNRRLGT
jgi:hypothetical protein